MENLAAEVEKAAGSGRTRDLYNITKTITNNGRRKMAAVKSKEGEVIRDKNARMERWKEHFNEVLNREAPDNPITKFEEIAVEEIEVDTGETDQRKRSGRSDQENKEWENTRRSGPDNSLACESIGSCIYSII